MFIITTDKNDMYKAFMNFSTDVKKINDGTNECFNYIYYNSTNLKFIYHEGYMRIIILNSHTSFIYSSTCYGNPNHSFKCISSSKIIASDRYYLYDPKTIKKFNIVVNSNYIANASEHGCVSILTWWINQKLPLEYDYRAIDYASRSGCINVLEWWKNSGLPLKYSEWALIYASSNGHINVLEWWKNSGLFLKYSKDALLYTYSNISVSVLEWWKNIIK